MMCRVPNSGTLAHCKKPHIVEPKDCSPALVQIRHRRYWWWAFGHPTFSEPLLKGYRFARGPGCGRLGVGNEGAGGLGFWV